MSQITVACTNCGASLKLADASKLGKKVACPKCKQPFVLTLSDEGVEDEFDDMDDAPAPASRPASKAAIGGKAKGKRGKTAGGGGTKGLLIGGGIVALLALVGVGLWGAGIFGGGDGAPAPVEAAAAPAAQLEPMAVAAPAQPAAVAGVDVSYLPPETEVLIHVRIADLLKSPLIAEQITRLKAQGQDPFAQFAGSPIQPLDIQSATFGIPQVTNQLVESESEGGGSLPAALMGPPSLDVPWIAVVRLTKPVTAAIFDSIRAEGQQVMEKSHSGRAYFLIENPQQADRVGAIAILEPTLLIGGPEDAVQAALDRGASPATGPTFGFLDASRHLLIAYAPGSLEQHRDKLTAGPAPPPALAALFQLHGLGARAAAVGATVSDRLDLALNVNAVDPATAALLKSQLDGLVQKAQAAVSAPQTSPDPIAAMIVPLVKPIADGLQTSTSGNLASVSTGLSKESLAQIGSGLQAAGPLLMMAAMSQMGGGPGGDPFDEGGMPGGGGGEAIIESGVPATTATGLPEGMQARAAASWGEVHSFPDEPVPPAPLSAGIVLFDGPGSQIVGYGRLRITQATAGGERLKRTTSSFSSSGNPAREFVAVDRDSYFEGHPENGLHIPLDFVHPLNDVAAIDAIDGSVVLQIAAESETIDVPDVASLIGQAATDPKLQAIDFRVTRSADAGNENVLSFVAAAPDVVIGRVEAIDAAGAVLGDVFITPSLGSDAPRGQRDISGMDALPAGLGLRIEIHRGIQETPVKFQFADLPVPPGEPLTDEQRAMATWRLSTAAGAPPDVIVEARAEWSTFAEFDLENNREFKPLNLTIDVTGGPAAEAVAIGGLVLTEAQPASLKQHNNMVVETADGFTPVAAQSGLGNPPLDGAQAIFSFEPPMPPIEAIVAASGSLRLRTVESQKTILVRNLGGLAGKVIQNEDVENAGLQLKVAKQDNQFSISVMKGNAAVIQEIRACDRDGQPNPDAFSSRGEINGRAEFGLIFSDEVPRDAAIELVLNIGLNEIEIPFAFENLAVPPPPPSE